MNSSRRKANDSTTPRKKDVVKKLYKKYEKNCTQVDQLMLPSIRKALRRCIQEGILCFKAPNTDQMDEFEIVYYNTHCNHKNDVYNLFPLFEALKQERYLHVRSIYVWSVQVILQDVVSLSSLFTISIYPIKHLELINCNLTGQLVARLSRDFMYCPTLISLVLDQNRSSSIFPSSLINNENIFNLLKQLISCGRCGDSLGDEGCVKLAKNLRGNRSIRCLSLKTCGITWNGCHHIGKLVATTAISDCVRMQRDPSLSYAMCLMRGFHAYSYTPCGFVVEISEASAKERVEHEIETRRREELEIRKLLKQQEKQKIDEKLKEGIIGILAADDDNKSLTPDNNNNNNNNSITNDTNDSNVKDSKNYANNDINNDISKDNNNQKNIKTKKYSTTLKPRSSSNPSSTNATTNNSDLPPVPSVGPWLDQLHVGRVNLCHHVPDEVVLKEMKMKLRKQSYNIQGMTEGSGNHDDVNNNNNNNCDRMFLSFEDLRINSRSQRPHNPHLLPTPQEQNDVTDDDFDVTNLQIHSKQLFIIAMQKLAKWIGSSDTLKELDLMGNEVGNLGGVFIREALRVREKNKLEPLKLHMTHKTSDDVALFVERYNRNQPKKLKK
ncbi:hypothetical protein HELRODRAFT_192915 [Helobdella robusta]|uniref:Uncharacterized protein n=1 Tax=Helobdella robusta TaxID=6412 RepID=T1FUF3_HELRO|nr:hypothetical protein HELRODRAFT_192915 [Helobdella robusta]ESN98430.1 hypothetical protein HELRODRAFT_192915 [Helobdella robusta]